MPKKLSARAYTPGIGEAVANRTINRTIQKPYKYARTMTIPFERSDEVTLAEQVKARMAFAGYVYESFEVGEETGDGEVLCHVKVTGRISREKWSDVAERVAKGNVALANKVVGDTELLDLEELDVVQDFIARGILLTSGRHLQHGDETQPNRNMEVFCNCSTSAASFISFYLLLNGSGVGRAYDDDMMVVDWSRMPIVVPVVDHAHADVLSGEINSLTRAEAEHTYKFANRTVFEVPDTREGWAEAVECLEVMAFEGRYDEVLIIDFSKVRPRGSMIRGMQDRPASGPGPLMEAFNKIKTIRGSGMKPWRAAMFVDHYLSECVLVGGARRAARMSTKSWRDEGVLEFIKIKRGGFLWSSNNSVTVDAEFWRLLGEQGPKAEYANRVFDRIAYAAYYDGTGEPGLINQDKLVDKGDKSIYLDGEVLTGGKYKATDAAKDMFKAIMLNASNMPYSMIVNPCGEIPLLMWGGYCVLADVVPYHAESDEDAIGAFEAATRFLIRVNLMDSVYWREVNRTNRIGVSLTGLHEYALKRFGYTWHDLIDEEKSKDFWMMLSRFKRAVDTEAERYSQEIGVVMPHTTTTVKPAGTTSKLFNLTEGAHLPAMREYLRWVQFRNDDPLLEQYGQMGYPMKKLKTYGGTTIVGFPTRPEICQIKGSENVVTASEAAPMEQYQWISLLEKYWIRGVDEDGKPLENDTGSQVSYTLKIDTDKVSFMEYMRTLIIGQSKVKCCSVMPYNSRQQQVYEYLPEEPITKERYEMTLEAINANGQSDQEKEVSEDVDMETLQCASGACPI